MAENEGAILMGDRPLPDGIYGRSPLRELYDKGAIHTAGRIARDTKTDVGNWANYLAEEAKATGRGAVDVTSDAMSRFMEGYGEGQVPAQQGKASTKAAPAMLQPPVSLADVGVQVPRTPIQDAREGVNADIDATAAAAKASAGRERVLADREQIAELRRRVAGGGTYADIDAEEASLYKAVTDAGKSVPSGFRDYFAKRRAGRRKEDTSALQAIDSNAHYVRSDNKAMQSAKELIRKSKLTTMTDVDNKYFDTLDLLAEPINKGHPVLMASLDVLESMKRDMEEQANAGVGVGVGTGENYVQARADGGEIMPMMEGMAPPEMPEAIPTEPMQLDSGDYIIPVEAMRFYGRKFFQDLINKAEDAE